MLLWAVCLYQCVRIPWWCYVELEVKREASTNSLLPASFVEAALTAISLPRRWRCSLLMLSFSCLNFYYDDAVMVLRFT